MPDDETRIGRVRYQDRGNYDSNTTYQPMDLVTYGYAKYYLGGTVSVRGIEPPVSPWVVFLSLEPFASNAITAETARGSAEVARAAAEQARKIQMETLLANLANLPIDGGAFVEEEADLVAAHNLSPTAHSNLRVDGLETGAQGGSGMTLEEHMIDPNAHPNLVIDANLQ